MRKTMAEENQKEDNGRRETSGRQMETSDQNQNKIIWKSMVEKKEERVGSKNMEDSKGIDYKPGIRSTSFSRQCNRPLSSIFLHWTLLCSCKIIFAAPTKQLYLWSLFLKEFTTGLQLISSLPPTKACTQNILLQTIQSNLRTCITMSLVC